MQDYYKTIISQYRGRSPILNNLITRFNEWISPRKNLNDFWQNVWNVDSATGYGLDVWGRIVGVTRVLEVATTPFFGYNEADDINLVGFGQAPFYNGNPELVSYRLGDDDFRKLILAKAFLNISDASVPSVNYIMMQLFGSQGQCWCTDGANSAGGSPMTMKYVFDFVPTEIDQSIILTSGVFIRPPGVKATIEVI